MRLARCFGGGPTLLTFGPPELSFNGGLVSCRHAIQGGLLALRAGGSVTLEQGREGDPQELSVAVEEYLPRLAARAGAPPWAGMLYAKWQSPLHVASHATKLRSTADSLVPPGSYVIEQSLTDCVEFESSPSCRLVYFVAPRLATSGLASDLQMVCPSFARFDARTTDSVA